MDLKHDWKALNEVLFQGFKLEEGDVSMILLADDDRAIDGVISSGAPFTDFGAEGVSTSKRILDELAAKYGATQSVVLSRKALDQAVADCAQHGTNYFQQLQAIRRELGSRGAASGAAVLSRRRHFALDLFGGWVRRLLPRRFNVLLFIDQRSPHDASQAKAAVGSFSYRAILVTYSRGKLDQFFEPDFSSLHENRLTNWPNESAAIGQYLENRYMLPCYGIFTYREEWERCLGSAKRGQPWRLFTRCYDQRRAAVYPNGWLAKTLLAAQRIRAYLSRAGSSRGIPCEERSGK